MNLSVIIPNYNGESLLKKNLPFVLTAAKEYRRGKVEIIIADDPSTDTSATVIADFVEYVKRKESNIIAKTISNKNKNESGFSKNVNRGVSLATGDILILLNTDVRPHKDFLMPLVAHFSDEDVFAVGCMDESIEDGKTILRGRGIGKWGKGFLQHDAGNLDKINTLWVSGGSGAFRKSIWDKLRGLDVLYNPFYWEDIDLSYRGLKAGYKVLFEHKSIVVHEHEEGAIRKKFKPYHIQKVAYRNQFIFVWKNITDFSFIFSHVFWLPYHLVNAARRQDKAFFAGFGHAVLQLPRIMAARERSRKLFKTSDRIVLNSHRE
ncbi:MAG TPA: glycosyltransferase [Patescibacteria group bacterium]|nr:glycosyltransferase [Patescibacteria group bacterium]